MNIYKFGGSLLSTAERIIKIHERIRKINECAIVLSAIGKIDDSDVKLTDLLIELCENRKLNNKKGIKRLIVKIQQKITTISKELNIGNDFYYEVSQFLRNIECYTDNYIISRGEYFTCRLFSIFSGIDFIDSAKLIKFDGNIFSYEKTMERVKKISSRKFITCGFYGSTENGDIILFSRGGGDTTGAILASIFNSPRYFNCTDVNGIYTIPPNYCDKKNTIKKLNYAQLYILANDGYNVFCKEAIRYLINKNITLTIINGLNFNGSYTVVTDNKPFNKISTIQVINKVKIITIIKSENNSFFGFIYDFLENIMSNKISLKYFMIKGKQYKILFTYKELPLKKIYKIKDVILIKKTTWSKTKKTIECKCLFNNSHKNQIKSAVNFLMKKSR